ncbi:MAG: methionyl-tRNA formyltransferase [Thermoflexales bacterium]|nr:methionyl-tRNA formyltransferase [Thermoflexales bacterium]
MARLIFMGTPEFAVPSLLALLRAGHEVALVVTQPDAPSGRGQKLQPPPVKIIAQEHGLAVIQPETLRSPEVVARLRSVAPEVIVVAAFGQILRCDVLEIPRHGCINVHASLLPRWRGAAPVSAAIAAGDVTTGVTIMLMDEGLDSGPILAQRETPICPNDTAGTLTARLAELGAALLVETLPHWISGAIVPQPQDPTRVTLAPRLKKEQGLIDWSRSAVEIERHVRAMSPWPSAFTFWGDKLLKIHRAALGSALASAAQLGYVHVQAGQALVRCGEGWLQLLEVQPEGKRAMPIADFLRGHPRFAGAVLNTKPQTP